VLRETSSRVAWATLAVAGVLCSPPARAQDGPYSDEGDFETLVDKRPSGLTVSVRTFGQSSFDADFDDVAGGVSVHRVGTSIGVGMPAGEKGRFNFGVDQETSFYDFDSSAGLTVAPSASTSDPLGTANRVNINLRYQRGFGRGWAVVLGAGTRFSGETGADFEDAITADGVAIVTRFLSKNARVGIGAAVTSRLEDDPRILPVAVVDWMITPRLRLRNSGSAGGTAGIELSYEIREWLAVAIDTGFERREFRLDDDGPVPSGVARDKRIPVALSVRIGDAQRVHLETRGGVYAWQEIEFLDNNGVDVGNPNMDPSAFFGATLTVRF